MTDPTPRQARDEFDQDLGPDDLGRQGGSHEDQSRSAADDKQAQARARDLDAAEMTRLSVLQEGTKLEQGSVYVDLNDPERRPFKALGGDVAGPENRYVAKRDTDYELWERLVGQGREAEVERPVSG